MIYLDNSATTLIKPKNVISAVNEALIHYSANPGRSGHSASIRCALKIEETREFLDQIGMPKAQQADQRNVSIQFFTGKA